MKTPFEYYSEQLVKELARFCDRGVIDAEIYCRLCLLNLDPSTENIEEFEAFLDEECRITSMTSPLAYELINNMRNASIYLADPEKAE